MPIGETKSRRPEKSAPRLPWRRILVPIDFSKTALRAFDVAAPLARDYGARLYLLSVIEPPVYPGGMEAVIIVTPDSKLVEAAKAELPKIAARFIPPSVEVQVLVKQGRAFDVITRVAKEKDIDLIVMTSHGYTGLERFLMGSTAERVVRHARCPVYVVRRGGNAGRTKEETRAAEPMPSQRKGEKGD